MGLRDTWTDIFKVVHVYIMFTMDRSKLLSACDICHLCQFTPLHARVKIISDVCATMRLRKVKYLDQHAHMHMVINAFAIPCAITI